MMATTVLPAFYYAKVPEDQWAEGPVTIDVPASLRPALFRAARDKADAYVAEAARLTRDMHADLAAPAPDDGGIISEILARGPEEATAKIEHLYRLWVDAEIAGDRLIGHSNPGKATSHETWDRRIAEAMLMAPA